MNGILAFSPSRSTTISTTPGAVPDGIAILSVVTVKKVTLVALPSTVTITLLLKFVP